MWDRSALLEAFQSCSVKTQDSSDRALSSEQLRPRCSSPVRVLGGFSSGKDVYTIQWGPASIPSEGTEDTSNFWGTLLGQHFLILLGGALRYPVVMCLPEGVCLSLSVFPSVSVLQPKCGFIPFSSDVTHDMKHRVCGYCMPAPQGRKGQLLSLLRALG